MTGALDRHIESVKISKLKPAKRNARTHSKHQTEQIAQSIKRFGFTNPVLIGDDYEIVAGHGRVAAAKQLGISEVPCVRLNGMTPTERRAYLIADNQLALNAGWDVEILAGELQDLIDLDFDMNLTGFGQADIDKILMDAAESSPVASGPEDDHPQPPLSPVTQPGDLWILGRHRLLCGDAKDPEVLEQLMGSVKADMVFTDSPYNLPIRGHVSGLGKARHREFSEASGEMSPAEFTEFLQAALENMERACRNGAIVFTCMDWRHLAELLAAGRMVFSELKNICVWSKTNGGMGTFYRSQHELVLVWKVGDAAHINNFGLGDKGRYRTNVWTYPGVNTFKAERMEELASHPTVKPVALVADAIRDVSHRGGIVLDAFGGSGTTLIAAEKTGRSARLLELDPTYCDVTIRRWERLTGKKAVLASTRQTFEEVRSLRGDAPLESIEENAA